MKKFLSAVILFNITFFYSQTYSFEYEFTHKDFPSPREIKDVAMVYVEASKPIRFYELITKSSEESFQQLSTSAYILPQKSSEFLVYSDDGKKFYIKDLLDEKYYFLVDTPKFEWKFENETKKIEDEILNKATTKFRGRNYTVWYKKNSKIQAAPWKFQAYQV